MQNKKWFIFLINLFLTFILFFISSSEYSLVHYINSVFYLTFLYIVIFLFMYIAKGGFFDGVTFSFRRFHHVILKRNDYLEEWKEKPLPSQKFNKRFYSVLKFQVISLFVYLLILLIIYYI
ncbi:MULTISPECIES: DUF3899 domain-containing protein [Niallia]|uniref:Uncharacterized protein n=1 Tax=Niallia circulans TaxID=1397 RepID=A0A268FF81_NIACI|nr:DUF3899 domain-containing protein [Niallia circulans]AYV68570.1 DUF3899 domain-containing protein [Niallia circulans]PAD84031.1 hypothetical protein CHH57_06130 [Niallia circulans]QJX64477.1 DUF3899 domain-containing protein [Niallia circulans]UQZ75371.1 DUF3899 domain-containing protein [Niallia circulans]